MIIPPLNLARVEIGAEGIVLRKRAVESLERIADALEKLCAEEEE